MKRSARFAVVGLFLCAVVCMNGGVLAAEPDSTLKMKPGDCTFKVLNPGGVKPVADAKVTLTDLSDPSKVLSGTANKKGACTLKNVPAGKYSLVVNGTKVATVEVSDSSKIILCRIVMPAAALPPGAVAGAGLVKWRYAFYGGVAIVTGAVVYDQVKDDNDDQGPVSR